MANTSLHPVEFLSDEVPATSSSTDSLSLLARPSKFKQSQSYKCETCPYTTRWRSNLKRHNKRRCCDEQLRGKTLHECGLCGYSTTRSNDLKSISVATLASVMLWNVMGRHYMNVTDVDIRRDGLEISKA